MYKKSVLVMAAIGLITLAACSKPPSVTSTQPPAVTSTQPPVVTSSTPPVDTTSIHVPSSGVKQAGNLRVWMVTTPAPLKPGNGVMDTYIIDANGQPVSDASLTYSVNMTNMNMGTNVTQPSLVSAGHYSKTVRFSMAGPWRVTITVVQGGQTNKVAFDFLVSY